MTFHWINVDSWREIGDFLFKDVHAYIARDRATLFRVAAFEHLSFIDSYYSRYVH